MRVQTTPQVDSLTKQQQPQFSSLYELQTGHLVVQAWMPTPQSSRSLQRAHDSCSICSLQAARTEMSVWHGHRPSALVQQSVETTQMRSVRRHVMDGDTKNAAINWSLRPSS
jgi:hypothetical protein